MLKMKEQNKIAIALEFSDLPSGRLIADTGDKSGEAFRENLLLPALKKAIAENTALTIDLTGMRGLNGSFLDEAFAGVIRKQCIKGLDSEQLLKILDFVPKKTYFDPFIGNITDYVKEAGQTYNSK